MIQQDPLPYIDDDDPELSAVEAELRRLDPTGDQVARVLRDTLDQIYDGQHTGRWNYSQLYKTEKTHVGTLVEINLHRQFGFADGTATDYRIAGIEVDCKYSMTYGGWELPPEAIYHICLLITANDQRSSWAAGGTGCRGGISTSGFFHAVAETIIVDAVEIRFCLGVVLFPQAHRIPAPAGVERDRFTVGGNG